MEKKKFITEQIYKIHVTYDGLSEWRYYIADSIEDAIAMCREDTPKWTIWNVERICYEAKRRSIKTITVEV